ncbi:unnamed protein product [Parnassius apollo]|uniref:(apollo) hypothetical protein n=1 Tax=Parnassius apollo TaxID=110799 RepID=A0A8S3WYT1_PARAO|nr:unnamed protein product [Parnassius apollo]
MSTSFYKDNLHELKRQWQFQSCKQVSRRKYDNTPVRKQILSPPTDNSDTSSDNIVPQTVDFTEKGVSYHSNSSSVLPSATITYDQFSALLDLKFSDMRSAIREDINCAICKLKAEFAETTDHLAALQCDMQTKLDIATKNIAKMETEKTTLESQIHKLNNRISTLEKISRGCNFEIQCVPEKKNEN